VTALVKRRYLYQAKCDRPRHKGKRSVYLVEILSGAEAYARVEHLGGVKGEDCKPELYLLAMNNNFSIVGDGDPIPKHVRWQIVLGTDYQEVK